MTTHTIATLPGSHERARTRLRKKWSNHVDDRSMAWIVRDGNEPAILVAGAQILIVISPGFAGFEYPIAYSTIARVNISRVELAIAIKSGQCYKFQFSEPGDAQTAADHLQIVADLEQPVGAVAVDETTPAQQTARDDLLIVTTDSVPGFEIIEVHGDALGVVVRARNVFSNIGASLRSIVGGEVGAYTQLLTETRIEARQRLIYDALSKGANAVVGMRYQSTEVADLMSEVAAYGTAVTIREAPPSHRESGHQVPASS